jgi:hypothetical protein
MSQQALANAIYAKLADTVSVDSIWTDLSGRIYHLQAPPDSQLPLLVFHIHTDRPQSYFSGSDDLEVEVHLELWGLAGPGASALTAIQDKVMGLLQHKVVSIVGYVNGACWALDSGRALADGKTLRITSRWQVRAAAV